MTQSDTKIIERVVELYFKGKTLREAIKQAVSEDVEGKHE